MARGLVGRILRAFVDVYRVDKAFRLAADNASDEALKVLESLAEDTSKLHDVGLLKGALLSNAQRHPEAVEQLASTVRAMKADSRMSRVESNYLVAYAAQYWRYSADQIGIPWNGDDDPLGVKTPIELGLVSATLRKKFPLRVPLAGVKIVP